MRSFWFIAAALIMGALWVRAQDVSLYLTQPSHDSTVLVTDTQPASQAITSHHPGLSAVTLRVEAPYPPPDQPVTLIVRDADDLALVISTTLPFSATSGPCIDPCATEGQGMRFLLPNQVDSERRAYVLEIVSGGAPVRLAAHTGDMYSEGQLLQPTMGGDLVFRLDYNNSLDEMIPSLARQIASGRPGISGHNAWFPAIGLVYGLMLILVLRKAHTLFTGW